MGHPPPPAAPMGMYKHQALPQRDTKTRASDGTQVSGTTPADYLLLARCQSCRRQIKAENALDADWKHTAAPRAPTGSTP
jgi:hypothetical protein